MQYHGSSRLAFVLALLAVGASLARAAPALESRQSSLGPGTCEYGSECDANGKNCKGAWICRTAGGAAVCASCTTTGQGCSVFMFPSGVLGCGVD